jgi:predicted unusual protein kinase regulating ubiquinone biosynthesis (AarF/ABC1/UbiB family)
VYKARAGGVSVSVKVQRPGLVAKIALDCYVLRGIAAGASVITRFPGLRFRSDFVSVVDEYASRLFEELDYSTEVCVYMYAYVYIKLYHMYYCALTCRVQKHMAYL